jgi:hypothetical protein
MGTENFAGPYGSLATINATFDRLVVDDGMRSGCAAIDDLSTTSAAGNQRRHHPVTPERP